MSKSKNDWGNIGGHLGGRFARPIGLATNGDLFLGIIKALSTSDQQGHRGGWHRHELISLTQHISTYDYYKKDWFGN
jgi:hypothetical protein